MTNITAKQNKVVVMKEFKSTLLWLIRKIEDFHDSEANRIDLKIFERIYQDLQRIHSTVTTYLKSEKKEVFYELLYELNWFIQHYKVYLQDLSKVRFRANIDFLQYLTFDLYKHLLENARDYFEDYI